MARLKGLKRLPLGEVKPQGWLRRELELSANGLTGHIDEVWEDLSDKSAWLGGRGEAWERGPYYLDGLIPLAFLLENDRLLKKVKKWVESILKSQNSEGGFGPARSRDWWPRAVALKALTSYHEATGDKRVITFMRKFFAYMEKEIAAFPPNLWGTSRILEYIIPLKYAFDKTGEPLLLELMERLDGFSYNWVDYFKNFKFKKPSGAYISKTAINAGRKLGAKRQAKQVNGIKPMREKSAASINALNNMPFAKKLMMLHGVNVAMALKYPALLGGVKGDESLFQVSKNGWATLNKYHGNATGMFSSDELLNGVMPTKGVELCAVVEGMFSAECLLETTGDTDFADKLEYLAFNALPATLTEDVTAHQYVQQANQIKASVAKRDFFDVDDDANIFGLKPNFGCCAANMHQGFPKFCQHLMYKGENELAFLVYSPCEIQTSINGATVKIVETTDYPFSGKIKIAVTELAEQVDCKLYFRVPELSKLEIKVNGKRESSADKGVIAVKKKLRQGDVFELSVTSPISLVENPDKTVSFRRGTLLLATKLNVERRRIAGKPPFCDYEITTPDDWRISPNVSKKLVPEVVTVFEAAIGDKPFSVKNPPLEVDIRAKITLNWGIYKDMAASYPDSPQFGEDCVVTLAPYGATDLRISHFSPNITKG